MDLLTCDSCGKDYLASNKQCNACNTEEITLENVYNTLTEEQQKEIKELLQANKQEN
jgi:uncharacterized OB-fold protein